MNKYYYEISLRQHVDDLDDDTISGYIILQDDDEDALEGQILALNSDILKDYLRCEIIFIDKIVKETQDEN